MVLTLILWAVTFAVEGFEGCGVDFNIAGCYSLRWRDLRAVVLTLILWAVIHCGGGI